LAHSERLFTRKILVGCRQLDLSLDVQRWVQNKTDFLWLIELNFLDLFEQL